MVFGTYIGPDYDLAGKTALLLYKDGGLLAQFDDRLTPNGLAYGWHKFALSDFIVYSGDFGPCQRKANDEDHRFDRPEVAKGD